MIIKGEKYIGHFECLTSKKESYEKKWGSHGDETMINVTDYWYEGTGMIKDAIKNEEFYFNAETNKTEKLNDLEKTIINLGDLKIEKEKYPLLIDFILEKSVKDIKEQKANGVAIPTLYFGKKIERKYLEHRGLISEISGQTNLALQD